MTVASFSSILLVGLGKMGQALARGWLAQGLSPEQLIAVDRSDAARAFAKNAGFVCLDGPESLTTLPDVVVFAVKPQVAADVVPLYQKFNGALVISIMAGITLSRFDEWLGEGHAVVRTMPNLPASVGAGMTALVANASVTSAQRQRAEELLSAVGATAWVDDESLMDAVTAISGSGPAWFFLLMEELIAAAEAEGLPPTLARTLVIETARGAAALADGEQTPAQLRQAVTSPGGTTAAGLDVFSRSGFSRMVREAVIAASRRSRVLSHI